MALEDGGQVPTRWDCSQGKGRCRHEGRHGLRVARRLIVIVSVIVQGKRSHEISGGTWGATNTYNDFVGSSASLVKETQWEIKENEKNNASDREWVNPGPEIT